MTEVVELFQERAKKKSISLHLHVDSTVPKYLNSDPSRLRQILINVIGNAVKFTSRGGVSIESTATFFRNHECLLSIRVKDTGVGLDPKQAEKLFQPFAQAESGTNRKFGGTGLGLAISLKLAKALGGTLRLTECAPEVGCTFEIEIRGHVPDLKLSTSKPEGVALNKKFGRLKGLRVLGVDDSEDNRNLMKFLLEREGAEFFQADSGEHSLELIGKMNFDVVLMDIQMPGLDGYQTISELRRKGYDRPVIALTAYAMTSERNKALSSGFDDHVTKPIDSNILVDAILRRQKKSQHVFEQPSQH